MGRYYSGDIEGKFWFALQSSNAADRFGVDGYQPEIIAYYFSKDDLDEVEIEINNIEENLGDKIGIIHEFFVNNNAYTNATLEEAGISKMDLKEYADLLLGIQIRDCIKDKGSCSFEAEV